MLLMHSINFAPKPKWNKNLKGNECLRFMIHTKNVEWKDVLNKGNQENGTNYKTFLPDKLKIQKLNQPINNSVDSKLKLIAV